VQPALLRPMLDKGTIPDALHPPAHDNMANDVVAH
jgi:hypothetical protein